MAGSQRRGREVRVVSRCRVEFDRPSGPVEAETEDMSARGLFVRTDALLPVSEETELRVWLPDDTLLQLRGRVVHMLTPSAARALGRHTGMGFQLVGPDSSARARLRTHLGSIQVETTNPGLSTTTLAVVIEPRAPLRQRLQRCLEGAGFNVTACAAVPDALEACAQRRPDVVVCAAMPDGGMSGVDLAYAMPEHATLFGVPLVLTGDGGDLSRLEAFRAGVSDYIPLPFLDDELVIRVHRVIAPVAPVTNPGLRGTLADIGLGTMLTLFEFERKSGILLMLCDGEVARVFVSEGRVLKVEASGAGARALAPKPRLMALLDWRSGTFEFAPCAIGGRDELQTTSTQLLLEHARTLDEKSAQEGARGAARPARR